MGEEKTERFLICPKCSQMDKERYFGTDGNSLGPEFEILNSMERCDAMFSENDEVTDFEGHSIKDTHPSMLRKGPKRENYIRAFLKAGIKEIDKRPFREVRPSLEVGDQVWIYRTNCLSRFMPYAHVAVYVGDNQVVHVASNSKCWVPCRAGCFRVGTIQRAPIGNVIKDDDPGMFILMILTITTGLLLSCSLPGPPDSRSLPLREFSRGDRQESSPLCFSAPFL